MCVRPKQITIKETGHVIYVPCGKCLQCQNQSRSEWVLRCKEELKVNKYAYFVTLTYDDKFLPADYMDTEERNLTFTNIKLGFVKDYSDFLVSKTDLSQFLKRLQTAYVETFHTILFHDVIGIRKKLAVARKCEDYEMAVRCKSWLLGHQFPKLRYMATAEYGKLTNRPHYHILLFSNDFISKEDLEFLVNDNWRLGKIEVDIPDDDTAVFNYVSKHQLKEDRGSAFQNKVAPIFKKCSTYHGGIGYNLRENQEIRLTYANRDTEPLVIRLPYNDDVNVFPFPRYVKKFLHPDKLSFVELSDLESDSTDRVLKMLADSGYHFSIKDVGTPAYLDAIKLVFHRNSVDDYKQKCDYFKQKYINKLLKHKKNGR